MLQLTLPGLGGSKKQANPQPQNMVKKRYWTPASDDKEAFDGYGGATDGYGGGTGGGMAGPPGSDYFHGDPWYDNKVWDKKKGQWIKTSDDIYRTNKDGDILQWQPETPKKKGLLK